jgi:hypothetical protein
VTERIVVWIISVVTIGAAVIINVAHSFGMLDWAAAWLKEYSPVLAAVLFAMIAIILSTVSTRLYRFQNSFESGSLSTRLQDLQDSLNAVSLLEIRPFNSPQEIYQYWTQRLQEAEKSVADLTWGNYPPHYTSTDKDALKAYVDYIPAVCGRGIRYREVMTFPNIERVTRARQMLNHKAHNYHLRYYDLGDHTRTPPLMQFSVIDTEEVFIFFYREPKAELGSGELRLAIRHPTIVRLFLDYFDAIWRVAEPLKQGDDVENDLLDKIETAVRTFSPQKPTPLPTFLRSDSKSKT